MKLAIVAAMKEELAPFREKYSASKRISRGKTVIEPQVISENDSLFLVETGIGKVNASAATSLLCESVKPDIIINTGSAGGFSENLNIGDVVVATNSTYSDVDATGFNYTYGQVPQMPDRYFLEHKWIEYLNCLPFPKNYKMQQGLIVTSDSFMSERGVVETIKKRFPEILASDMESTAIMQIAYFYQIPVFNIRGISDIAGQNAAESFEKNLEKAALHAFEQTILVVESLLKANLNV